MEVMTEPKLLIAPDGRTSTETRLRRRDRMSQLMELVGFPTPKSRDHESLGSTLLLSRGFVWK